MWSLGQLARRAAAVLAAAGALLALPAVALGGFPGSDPNESVRANTPNDPGYDRCENDRPGGAECSTAFEEDYERFGFAPRSTERTATYADPSAAARLIEQNRLAGRNPLGQVPGISADRAWKRSIGRPDVQIAILDTGIRWDRRELRARVALNRGELPLPQGCTEYDCNGDGAFNVEDYASDPRVRKEAGVAEAKALLDASDLIYTFTDGTDADGNGYADDIAGWDFFDDDNDPYDASSYSSASNHGSGRAEEAAAEGNNGESGIGVCPRCQIVPLRVWDTFVVDTNNFGLASMYAADNRIEVVEAALGGLSNTRFVRDAMRDAYRRGVFFAIVSSDLNTASHNWPTTYDEAMMVQGTVADVQGLGSEAAEFGSFFGAIGLPTQAPLRTWFRNSGTTQYGEHAHVTMPAVTGSQATGQASGAAGLVISYAREKGAFLAPNEVKQILTLTAEDVLPANTAGLGTPDPAQPGWDRHFGYGKPDLGHALERIAEGRIPPQARITTPAWFAPLEIGREGAVEIGGIAAAKRAGSFEWELQWAPGAEPAEGEFRRAAGGRGRRQFKGRFATLDLAQVRRALDRRPGGGAAPDPTAPYQPGADLDPNEPAFTVRLVVTDARGVRGEDRKLLFAYRDGTLRRGWPLDLRGGGEASARLWDVDGDAALDAVIADSSGVLRVVGADGRRVRRFARGGVRRTKVVANAHRRSPGLRRVDPPRETLRTPAIGDVDGDREADIVVAAGERVYAWHLDGRRVRGFPVRLDPAFSLPPDRTRTNHVKRGFISSAVLADLRGDGALEVVVAGLDGKLYAWDGRGRGLPGFPADLHEKGLDRAESINTPAVGDVDGDRRPDIVVPSAELDDNPQNPPPGAPGDQLKGAAINLLANQLGGSGRTYAFSAEGKLLPGWPVKPNGALPDALPLVGPGVDWILANVDGDEPLEAIGAVTTGDLAAWNGDGSHAVTYDPAPATGEHADKSRIVNFFEYPVAADIDGRPGAEVLKGGLTLNQLLNVGVLTGQNLPYSHVVQAWYGPSGQSLPRWPQAVEDFQLLSSPAVADVGGGAGHEVVVGTGLYLLRAIDGQGREAPGWPKFTGGWIFAVPAIGDADGDGDADVLTLTREGKAFMWSTGRSVCSTRDDAWPTSRHDERSSGAEGTDARPPSAPRALRATRRGRSVELSWLAPGDDWSCGKAERFEVRWSRRPIRRLSDGAAAGQEPAAAKAGERAATTLHGRPARARYAAVAYRDDAGNWGLAATVKLPRP